MDGFQTASKRPSADSESELAAKRLVLWIYAVAEAGSPESMVSMTRTSGELRNDQPQVANGLGDLPKSGVQGDSPAAER